MNDIPDVNYAIREILNNNEVKYDHDVVVLDLTSLYILRPTYTKLPTSLGILIPGDLGDAFDSIFIRSLVEAIVEHGVHVTNTDDLLMHAENAINMSLHTTYMFNLDSKDVQEYLLRFYNIVKELVDKYTEGYYNVGIIKDCDMIGRLDRFYTLSDLNVYINNDRANMQILIKLWTRSMWWS